MQWPSLMGCTATQIGMDNLGDTCNSSRLSCAGPRHPPTHPPRCTPRSLTRIPEVHSKSSRLTAKRLAEMVSRGSQVNMVPE
eukprot:5860148-Amphidinium_carterae.1